MNTDKQEAQDNNKMIEEIMLLFNERIKYQEQQNLQINRRTSSIIRYGLAIIILFSMGIAFLTWSQKDDINKMGEYMKGMTTDISVMSNAIVTMQTSMSTIEAGINKVGTHTQSISSLVSRKENSFEELSHIADSVKLMQSDAQGLVKTMESVSYNLSTINSQMKSLNRKLGLMVQDSNRMPSPTRMFPF